MQKKDRLYLLWMAILCLSMSAITISLIEIIIRSDIEHQRALLDNALMDNATLISEDIQHNITSGIFSTQLLESLLKLNDYKVSDFATWGHLILTKKSEKKIVQLAPDGIISFCYPLSGNENVIGVDLLKNERNNDGALKSIRSEKLTFVGPLRLMQSGEYAVIARRPIFRDEAGVRTFWGFATAILFAQDILPKNLNQMEREGLLIKIKGDDPDIEEQPIFYESPNWDDRHSIDVAIDVPNGKWLLQLGYARIDHTNHVGLRIAAFCISIGLFTLLFFQQYYMQKKQRQIIYLNEKLKDLSMRDDLTGVGNRRACMNSLKQHQEQAKRYNVTFSIAIIDLDNFKQINDIYGHLAGDGLLRHISSCLVKSTRENDMVFRVGGDEFLIVYPQTDLTNGSNALQKTIQYLREYPGDFAGNTLPVSLSAGLAEYHETESLETMLARADAKLYDSKNAGRNTLSY